MNRPALPFLSRAEGNDLHLRLCTADATAPAALCRAYLEPLLGWLGRRFPAVDPHLWQTAAEDALFGYLRNPHVFDPLRSDLAAYLRMAACGDLRNLLRREWRHQKRRVGWPVVENAVASGNLMGREEEPSRCLERAEETATRADRLRTLTQRFTEGERRVLELLRDGERRTALYAAALGLDGLPPAEQERRVKQTKDRLKKRLERGGLRDD